MSIWSNRALGLSQVLHTSRREKSPTTAQKPELQPLGCAPHGDAPAEAGAISGGFGLRLLRIQSVLHRAELLTFATRLLKEEVLWPLGIVLYPANSAPKQIAG